MPRPDADDPAATRDRPEAPEPPPTVADTAEGDPYATREGPAPGASTIPEPAGAPGPTSGPGEWPGREVGRFTVVRFHARGGLGQVSLALDRELDRPVAFKEIQERHADHPVSRARFVLEAEVTGKLEHPGIVPVYGRGEHPDGRPYYAMRFIRGETLTEAADRHHAEPASARDPGRRELRLRELLGRFLDACDAIAYAHSRGVIHRDIKPANVMLGPFGETLVVDWGLARAGGLDQAPTTGREVGGVEPVRLGGSGTDLAATVAGSAIGSPPFMSPEQADGDLAQLGPASDVFNLGATLFYILTGQAPYGGTRLSEVLDRARRADFPTPRALEPSVPRALEAICLKAMAREPARRYESSGALADDLRRWLADEPVAAWREGAVARAGRWARRHKTPVAAASALLLTSVVALTLGLWQVGLARARAERSAALARSRFGLALDAFGTLVYDLQDRLKDRAGSEAVRSELLGTAFVGVERLLDQAGAEADGSGQADHLIFAARVQAGDLALQLGRAGQARRQFEEARGIADRLARVDPADPRTPRERSIALNRLGDLAMVDGDLGAAGELYRQAEGLVRSLVLADPRGRQAWRDLWVARCKMGDVRRARGDLDGAGVDYRRALELARSLVEGDPDPARARVDLAASLVRLGDLDADRRDPGGAGARYDEALNLLGPLLGPGSDGPRKVRRALTIALDRRADLALARDDFAAALAASDRSLALAEGLHREDPADARLRRDLSIGYNKRGNARYLLEDVASAAEDYGRALEHAEAALALEPGGLQARRDVSVAANRLGDTSLALGDLAAAGRSFRRSLDLREALARSNPRSVTARFDLGITEWDLGELALAEYRPGEARPWFERAVGSLDRLIADGSVPKDPRRESLRDYLRRRVEFSRLCDPDRLDLALVARFPASFRPRLLAPRAVALARAGRAAEAAEAAEALAVPAAEGDAESATEGAGALGVVAASLHDGPDRERLLARAVALLERARDLGGFATPTARARLGRAADLDSLRGRPDFQALRLDASFPIRPFAR